MGNSFLKVAGFLLLLATSGCAPGGLNLLHSRGEGSQTFRAQLKKGKSPVYAGSVSSGNFGFIAGSGPVRVDRATGRHAYASYLPSNKTAVTEAELARHSLQFLHGNPAFGLDAGDLQPAPNFKIKEFNGNIVLTFNRFHRGIPVDNATIQLVFAPVAGGYALREVLNRAYGDIDLPVRQGLTRLDADLAAVTGLDTLVPMKSSEVIFVSKGSDDLYQYQLASRQRVQDQLSGEEFTITLGSQGEILEAYSHIHSVQHAIQAEVVDRSYVFNKSINLPLSFATIAGQVADKDGKVDITPGDTVTITLDSAQARGAVRNDGQNVPVSLTLQTIAGQNTTVYALNQTDLPALNAYTAINVIVDHVSKYLNPAQVPFLSRKIGVTVNINDVCNAFYTNATVNFFIAGRLAQANLDCANTANISDVVYHEWGHGLDDFTGTQVGITDGAFSEGIGDIVSGYKTNSPVVGPGFQLNSTDGIRTMQNTKRYPGDLVNEVHDDGEIIGGAFWDMRVALIERYGPDAGGTLADTLFYNHLLTTDTYTASYDAVVRLDDDDNNPATRSPNFCLISGSFAGHGLAEVPGADCVDDVVLFDDSLKLAIRSDDNTGVVTLWAAAAEGAGGVAVCLGPRATCVKSKELDVRFVKDHPTGDGIDIYYSSEKFSVVDGSVMTLFSLDAEGKVIAAREVEFGVPAAVAP